MITSRRALRAAVAGFVVWCTALAPAQESRRGTPIDDPAAYERFAAAMQAAKATTDAGNLGHALRAYDAVTVDFNDWFDQHGGTGSASFVDLYASLLGRIDSLADKIETPEFESAIPFRDLLSATERGAWKTGGEGQAIFETKGLTIAPESRAQRKRPGYAAVGVDRSAPWRDLVIDLEFTLLQGAMELQLRHWPDKRPHPIRLAPNRGHELGKAYAMTIRVKGSRITLTAPDGTVTSDRLDHNTSLTGGIAFVVEPGSKAVISRLKVKVLRTALALAQDSRSQSRPVSRPAVSAEDLAAGLESTRLAALAEYDAAIDRLNDEFAAHRGSTDLRILSLYIQLLADSDWLVERVETPQFEDRIPERDFLSTAERTWWGTSIGARFVFDDDKRDVALEGVSVEQKRLMGIVSCLPPRKKPWHDIVMDMEFTIVTGELDLYLRYWPDKKPYSIRFNAQSGYEPNKPYRMTIRVKGSSISLKQADQPENRDRLEPGVSRTGGIGFALNPGSKVTISRLKVKVLR